MSKKDIIEIEFNGRNYNIDLNKIILVLCALNGKKIETRDKTYIKELMKYYDLYDEYFLENINNLLI